MSVTRTDILSPAPAEQYRGTFAATDAALPSGAALPAAWEGLYFPYDAAFADLRADGSPARDGVTPEVDLPRRLFAGETTEFLRPLHLGDEVLQTVSLGKVAEKQGSGGRLMFVDVVREYAVDGEIAVRSTWHDVFLEASDPDAPARPPRRDAEAAASAEWIDEDTFDIRRLFRFSAITFNTHLVHLDRGWAREVEGLDDLLVHGPLTRILTMDAARRHAPDRVARGLALKSVAPVYVDRPVRFAGRTIGDTTTVTVLGDDDAVLAVATVTWA